MYAQLGKLGKLDDEILEEWDFWRLVKWDFSVFVNQDKISYIDIQKLNAILDMAEDIEGGINAFYDEKNDKMKGK